MKMSDKTYDAIKWLIVIVMPSIATAIIAYGELFNWEPAQVIAQSITIAQTFLGGIFAVSCVKYNAQKNNGITTIKEDIQEGE